MERPLFEVNEKVSLVSTEWPHLNGPATVLAIYNALPGAYCISCGAGRNNEPAFAYGITIPHPNAWDNDAWCGCVLRKRPDPGKLSFPDLMVELKDDLSPSTKPEEELVHVDSIHDRDDLMD
jgi:hypothetical protein